MTDLNIKNANAAQKKELQIKLVTSQPHPQPHNHEETLEANTIHKKRRRKHYRKQKIIRDPQQIKSIRLERLNVKREVHWDNHFVNDTIPEFFKPKVRKVYHASRNRPLQSAYVQKERQKLPELRHETANRNHHRAFKIRSIKKQNETNLVLPSKDQTKRQTIQQQSEAIKKISKRQKNKQRLLLKLQQKTKLFPINKNYRDLIVDLIGKANQKKHKPLRSTIQKQIDSIGGNDNVYARLQKMVEERKSMLKNIKSNGADTILKTYIDLQMHSLALIEEILKFKAKWEAIYQDNLHSPTKVDFYYEDCSYLQKMSKEVEDIAENDPFLICKSANLQKMVNLQPKEKQLLQRKELMLKIRACELLLIQEQLQENI